MITLYSILKRVLNLRISLLLIASLVVWNSCTTAPDDNIPLSEEQTELLQQMQQIVDFEVATNSIHNAPPDWINSTFYVGLTHAYNSTRSNDFLDLLLTWSQNNRWKTGSRKFHADDQLAAYVFLSLYDIYRKPGMILDLKTKISDQLSDTSMVWWWADALFMAPPAFQYANTLNVQSTEEYIFREWKKTHELLYSKNDSLFYRDKKFNNHIDQDNNKQFWLRGNGWVVAGLALQLSKMEKSNQHFKFYSGIFTEMLEKLQGIQKPGDLWSMDLLNTTKFPQPESSGSALICFAITEGVNVGLLKKQTYNQLIEECYKNISDQISDSGRVINVQPPNAKPEAFDPNNTEAYGAGAVLLFLSAYFDYTSDF